MSLLIKPYQLEGKKGFRAYLNKTPLSRKPVEVERAIQQADALRKGGKAEDIKSYPLSETDMRKVIPTLKIISYTDLLDASSIDDVLDEKGRLMLLYLTENESTGHWVCLLKLRDQPILEYFDPYGGYKPDGEKTWLSKEKQKEFGQDTNKLTKLLENSSYEIKSNAVPFQASSDDMNTCGRHCLARLYFKHLDLPGYTDMVKQSCKGGLTPDDFVSGFTYNLIGK
jgi:hypothetical protein